MKLSGTAKLAGRPEEVFDRLLDPEVIASCIPGCQRLERVDEGEYELEIKTGIGAVRGRATLSDVRRFQGYRMDLEGKSPVGRIQGWVTVRLEGAGKTTHIHYDGEGKISGLFASMGSRMLESSAGKGAQQFFERLALAVAART